MTAPGLFPEPERVELPAGPWARAATGWSYGFFGEDGEYLVIAGWAPAEAVAEVFTAAGIEFDPLEYAPLHVWAHELTRCPEHDQATADCRRCKEVLPDDPWLDWGSASQDPDVRRGQPGYFRVTVIDLEG